MSVGPYRSQALAEAAEDAGGLSGETRSNVVFEVVSPCGPIDFRIGE